MACRRCRRLSSLYTVRSAATARGRARAIAADGRGVRAGPVRKRSLRTLAWPRTVGRGSLSFRLRVVPPGRRTRPGPIPPAFGGPFQSRGKEKLPASDFNVSISASGKTGSLGIVSTGTSGYVTLQGTGYQLPATTFQKLESSFAGIGGGSGTPGLSKLGINPLHWLIK